MNPGLIILPDNLLAKRITISLVVLLFAFSKTVTAQDSEKPNQRLIHLYFHPAKKNPYPSYNYPLPANIDYSNARLTPQEVEDRLKRHSSNKNTMPYDYKKSFISNLLGLQRIPKAHADPKF